MGRAACCRFRSFTHPIVPLGVHFPSTVRRETLAYPSPQAFLARSILDSSVSCDVTERDSPPLSQTSRVQRGGKRERLRTRLRENSFSPSCLETSFPCSSPQLTLVSFSSEGRVREDPGNEESCLASTFAKANYLGSFDNKPLFF